MYDPYDLAYVGKVIEVSGEEALVDINGLKKKVCIALVDAKVGDYVLVHAGYAIQVVDEEEAKRMLKGVILNLIKETINK
ncbi:MAG: HypC/HybG/HupF family hydrogenase formation chaperone [Sulfolobaceae archaeon]